MDPELLRRAREASGVAATVATDKTTNESNSACNADAAWDDEASTTLSSYYILSEHRVIEKNCRGLYSPQAFAVVFQYIFPLVFQ